MDMEPLVALVVEVLVAAVEGVAEINLNEFSRALFTGLTYFAIYRAGEVSGGWGYGEINTTAIFAFGLYREH